MSGDPVAPEPKNGGLIHPFDEALPPETTPPPAQTHFDTVIPTTYELPLDLQPAVLSHDEPVENWLGPVNKQGGSDISSHYEKTGHGRRSIVEVDRDALNTLLFTSSQIIGLMLGPDDLQSLDSGPLTTAANQVVQHYMWSRDSGRSKGLQFGSLNARHWGDMVAALCAQPLEAALRNHLNCGMPYDTIQSIEVKSRFINPGVTIRFSDGSYLWYGTFGKRDRLSDVATFLGSHVKVT